VPLAAMTAIYTGYLFAQAKGRDLWQSPLLPPHLLIEAVLAGSAVLVPFAAWLEPSALQATLITLGIACVAHVLFVVGEITLSHVTAHAQVAVNTMTRGRYAVLFWGGLALAALGALACIAPGPIAFGASALALAGLLAHEHAYVQAGQSVPLA
jgi:Ni/Fe-hydrogenase subunit HybB-like protein